MSLTYEEIENCLVSIFCSIKYICIDDLFLTFKFPSNSTKLRANFVYSRSYNDAVKGGILPVKELEELVDRRNLISASDMSQLSKLKAQLEAQKIILGKTTRVKANQERIKNIINRLNTDINNIEFKKSSKLFMSAESKADEDKTFYLCSCCVYKEDDTLLWPTYEIALKENRLEFKNDILVEYLRFYSGFPISTIREIARSSIWRIRYINSMKTSDPLFGVPASCYTNDQLSLVYWSNYYQNIYEMMSEDRPSDMVINDDDALDAYMQEYYSERTREDSVRRSTNKRPGKLSAFDSAEVIITRSHELYEDIEYDTPKEAQQLKDRVDIKKRTKRKG